MQSYLRAIITALQNLGSSVMQGTLELICWFLFVKSEKVFEFEFELPKKHSIILN